MTIKNKVMGYISGDIAPIKSYVLFPKDMANMMGTKSSGSLAVDSGRSHMTRISMYDLILNSNGIREEEQQKSANDIIEVKVDSKKNIDLDTFIGQMDIKGFGIGDIYNIFADYGLENYEINQKVFGVLQVKFQNYQEQLEKKINEIRAENLNLESTTYQAPVIMQFLNEIPNNGNIYSQNPPDPTKQIIIENEPILV
jgi:hypothetical protein